MQRRDFIALVGASAVSWISGPFTASAQTTSKVYRLGTLGTRDALDDKSHFGSIFVRVLAERGYALGQNLVAGEPWSSPRQNMPRPFRNAPMPSPPNSGKSSR